MATIASAGTLTNRELQVYNAYNDVDHGYITLLQKQVDEASLSVKDANTKLQTANSNLASLKDGLATLKTSGFSTADLPHVKQWVYAILPIGGTSMRSAQQVADIVVPTPLYADTAALWLAWANEQINTLNSVKSLFNIPYGGYAPIGANVTTKTGTYIWSSTFGQEIIELQALIQAVSAKLANYNASIISIQAAIDSQTAILEAAQATYVEAQENVKALNKDMTALLAKYQTDMAGAADTDAQAAQTALQLQLASDPEYQAAVLAKETLELQQENELAKSTLEAATEVQTAQIEADKVLELQRITAAAEANKATMAAAAAATEQAAKAARMRKNIIIGVSIFAILAIGVTAIMVFKKE